MCTALHSCKIKFQIFLYSFCLGVRGVVELLHRLLFFPFQCLAMLVFEFTDS